MQGKKSSKLKPAQLVAERFGSAANLSKLLESHPSRVSVWICRGGTIPNQDGMHERLLELAKEKKVRLLLKQCPT